MRSGVGDEALPVLLHGTTPAPLGARVLAVVADVVAITAAAVVPALLTRAGDALPGGGPLALGAVTGAAALALTLAAHCLTGRTLARLALGLRTVDLFTGLPLGLRGTPHQRWTGSVVLDVRRGRDPLRTVSDTALAPLVAALGTRPPADPPAVERPTRRSTADRLPVDDAAPARTAVVDRHPDPLPPSLADTRTPDPVPGTHHAAPATPDGTSPTVVIALDDGQRFEIHGLVLVGRNPSPRPGEPVDLVVPVNDLSRSVSKTHALLRWDGHRLWVTDRGSTNGTVVRTARGEVAVTTGAEVPAEPGATIALGDRTILVEPPAPAAGGAR